MLSQTCRKFVYYLVYSIYNLNFVKNNILFEKNVSKCSDLFIHSFCTYVVFRMDTIQRQRWFEYFLPSFLQELKIKKLKLNKKTWKCPNHGSVLKLQLKQKNWNQLDLDPWGQKFNQNKIIFENYNFLVQASNDPSWNVNRPQSCSCSNDARIMRGNNRSSNRARNWKFHLARI